MRQPLLRIAAAIEPALISALLGSASLCKGLTSTLDPVIWRLVVTFTDTHTSRGVQRSATRLRISFTIQ